MTTGMLPPVESEFPGWFAALQMADNPTVRQARLKGMAALSKNPSRDDVEALVRMAFQTKRGPSAASVDSIRGRFLETDPTFPATGNEREMQILAGACLARFMEASPLPSLTALAVTCAACGSARSANLPMDLSHRAEAILLQLAELNRKRPKIALTFPELDELDFIAAINKVNTTNSWAAVAEAFAEAQESLTKAFAERGEQEMAILKQINSHLQMKDEELQMLWWLIGQRSFKLDCDFSEVSADAQPFVFAEDLAECTGLLPGPASIRGLLSRAGLREKKKLRLTTAVSAVPLPWARTIVGEREFSPVTAPLHFALQRRLENDEGDQWIPNWASVTGIPATHVVTALTLGVLFYRERLLATWS